MHGMSNIKKSLKRRNKLCGAVRRNTFWFDVQGSPAVSIQKSRGEQFDVQI